MPMVEISLFQAVAMEKHSTFITISWFNILETNTTYGPKAFCLEMITLASAAGLRLEGY